MGKYIIGVYFKMKHYCDIIIGAPGSGGAGQCYVIFGQNSSEAESELSGELSTDVMEEM